MEMMIEKTNFKKILNNTIEVVGVEQLFDVVIAIKTDEMINDIFDIKTLKDEDFNRVCYYIKNVYDETDVDLDDIIYSVGTIVESNDVDTLEKLSLDDFIEESTLIMSA